MDRLKSDPERFLPVMVEEAVRLEAPVQRLLRTTAVDVELHGVTIPAGSLVLIGYSAANRDERVFHEPDRYDLLRDHSESLSFGKGTHFCLGASLARLEARVGLEAVLRRFPDYEIDAGRLVRVHSTNVRGFSSIPITF